MKITIERILIIALSVLAVLLFFRKCEIQKDFDSFQQELELKFKENNTRLLDAENRVYQGDLVIAENSKKIQNLVDSIDYIRKIKSLVKVVSNTKIDTVEIPFEVPVLVDPDLSTFIKVPISFNKKTDWYSISGSIEKNGLFFDSLSYKNDFLIITGDVDHGSFIKNLFKANETTVTIKDNNPYSKTSTLHQTLIKDRKRHWHVGPQAGFFIIDKELVPSVGIGVTYSIINF